MEVRSIKPNTPRDLVLRYVQEMNKWLKDARVIFEFLQQNVPHEAHSALDFIKEIESTRSQLVSAIKAYCKGEEIRHLH